MAHGESGKDFYGLGTNTFEVKGDLCHCAGEETYEQYVERYKEPLRRNELRQTFRDAIDLFTFGKRCLGQLNELLPTRGSEQTPYPTQFEILQPKPAKSETSLVRRKEADAETEWKEEEAMINRRLEDIEAHGSSISSAIERIATSLAPHEPADEKSNPQFLWKVLCNGDPQWDAKLGIRCSSWRDHIHRTTLPPPYKPYSKRHKIDGAPTPYITLHEYPAYAVEEIYSIQELVARGLPGVVALVSTALMQKLGVNFRKRSAIERKKLDNTVEDVWEASSEDPYAWWAELWVPTCAIVRYYDFKEFCLECRLKGVLDGKFTLSHTQQCCYLHVSGGNNVKPEAYREVMKIRPMNLYGRRLKNSAADLPPARSKVSPEADQGANPGATGQSSSVKAPSQQVEPRQESLTSQPLEHPDVHDAAKEGSSTAAQVSSEGSSQASGSSPKQEASTTREPADVGTLTSTNTVGQATVIRLPTGEVPAGASQPQPAATASTRPPSLLQPPAQLTFSSSRDPADVELLTQNAGVDPVVRLPIATSPTGDTPLNPNAAPFVPDSHSFPASAPSQSSHGPTNAVLVSSNVAPSATGAAGPSTSNTQPASSVSNNSSNTATPAPLTTNNASGTANLGSDTTQGQLTGTSYEESDDPPVVPPGQISDVASGIANSVSDTTQEQLLDVNSEKSDDPPVVPPGAPSNVTSGNANLVPNTSEAEQEQLIDVSYEESDSPPGVPPGATSNVALGNTNVGPDTSGAEQEQLIDVSYEESDNAPVVQPGTPQPHR